MSLTLTKKTAQVTIRTERDQEIQRCLDLVWKSPWHSYTLLIILSSKIKREEKRLAREVRPQGKPEGTYLVLL